MNSGGILIILSGIGIMRIFQIQPASLVVTGIIGQIHYLVSYLN
jgi:hypothetical protein